MIGIQDGLDWGVGWLGWFPQTEDTTMFGIWTGHCAEDVAAYMYLKCPDAAPLLDMDFHQGQNEVSQHAGEMG